MAARGRAIVVAGALAGLLIAPATWAAQTLGHATSGTFPAGGPATSSFGGGGGAGGPGGQSAGGFARGGFTPPAGAGAGGPPAGGAPPSGLTRGGGTGGGGPFGGNSTGLTAAAKYVKAHGGGTIAVSSQQGASDAIISSGVNVAALGGFSGRESEVSVAWLKQAVREGRVRWVLVDSSSSSGM